MCQGCGPKKKKKRQTNKRVGVVLLSLVLCEYVQEMGQRRDSIPGFKELPSLLGREGSHQKKFIYTQSYGAGEGMGQRAPRGETSAIGEG